MNLRKFRMYKQSNKKFKLSERAYHITFRRNLESILNNGLMPVSGSRKNFEWCEDGVHLSSYKYGGLDCIGMLYVDKKEEGIQVNGELVLLEIDMSLLDTSKLNTGEAFEDWNNPEARVAEWIYYGIIPPNCFKVVPIKTKFRNEEMNKAFRLGKYSRG